MGDLFEQAEQLPDQLPAGAFHLSRPGAEIAWSFDVEAHHQGDAITRSFEELALALGGLELLAEICAGAKVTAVAIPEGDEEQLPDGPATGS